MLLLLLGVCLTVATAFALLLARAETGVEELQHLGRELARLQAAEGWLDVVADDALGPLVRGLDELGDTEPAIEQERHRHPGLGVAQLVDLIEESGADLLGLGPGFGLLGEADFIRREPVEAGIDPDLEAVPVGPDAAAQTSLGCRVRHDNGTYSWPMPWPRRSARLPQ
ncbi:hypothetical protein J7E87_30455 [Streptomyces sp. ISL-1]|uniref:hypothetical protein n=1 Tax=Streptomyces sp. ISL-1 TaxID=2817657 RepID=UPI001BEBAABC|nr:hypothetical protein [Streptomyces sp. ISL-1]MBT2393615.1 hypothetical protein [Streptomyces sp. ISL-1]